MNVKLALSFFFFFHLEENLERPEEILITVLVFYLAAAGFICLKHNFLLQF